MRMDNKRRDAIVQSFNSRWKYRYDKDQYGMTDAWKIIYAPDIEGNYVVIVNICYKHDDCML